MKKLLTLIFCTWATGALAAPAEAQPGYGAAKELRARYDLRRAQAKKPPRSQPQTRPETGAEPLSASGRLEQVLDAAILLSVPVTPEQQEVLRAQGFTKVERVEDLAASTLYGDRAYLRYRLGPSREACPSCDGSLLGPEEDRLSSRVGQEVRLVLNRDRQGLLLVTAVERAP